MDFTVDTPQRLDAFLSDNLSDMSRARIQKAIKAGEVSVDGTIITKPSLQLETDQLVTYNLQLTTTHQLSINSNPINLSLSILHEDTSCLVINKSAGIAVHPGTGMAPDETTLLNGIAYLFKERSIPFDPSAVLVHRLDKDTTGCLLIAKNPQSHHKLQKQFEERSVQKTYLALVAGIPKDTEALIDAPIGRNLHDRTKMSVLQTGKTREARTTYRILDTSNETSLLECDLHTGRTHQIRVHLSTIGHPILSDDMYGSPESKALSKKYSVDQMCLHAWKLSFQSQESTTISVTTPIPEAFTQNAKNCDIFIQQ